MMSNVSSLMFSNVVVGFPNAIAVDAEVGWAAPRPVRTAVARGGQVSSFFFGW